MNGSFSTGGISATPLLSLASWVALFDARQITPVADATALSTWSDVSGNGRNATQTGGARPVYKIASNGINSQPVVRFTAASSQFMTTVSGALSMTGDFYMAAVLRLTTNGNEYQTILAFGEEADGKRREMLKWDNTFSKRIGFNGYLEDVTPGGITPTAGVAYFCEITRASGVITVYLNGTVTSSGSPSLNAFASDIITLGSNNSGGSEYLNGDFALCGFVASIPTTSNWQKIRGYVFATYAIPMEGLAGAGYIPKTTSGLEVLSSLFDNGQDLGFYGRRLYGVSTGSNMEHVLKDTELGRNVLCLQNTNAAGFSVVYGKGYDVADGTEGYGNATGWGNTSANPLAFRGVGFWEVFNSLTTSFYAARIIQTNSAGNYRRVDIESTSGDIVFYRRDAVYPSETEVFRLKATGVLNIPHVPTSPSGLSSGDIYSNVGILTIV